MHKKGQWAEFHFKVPVIDAHCDTLTVIEEQGRRFGERSLLGHVDLPRLIEGGVSLQFFAAFIAPEHRNQALCRALEIIDLFYRELEDNSNKVMLVKSLKDLEEAFSRRRFAALLSIEGGEALSGNLAVLRMLYRLGVRSITLTWNHRNELADGVAERCTGGGLTNFGKDAVLEMNRLGILVDVSHLAERGFWDVLGLSRHPVIASHSNCKKLCDHPRNLNDEQIKALAKNKGVMGICFYPHFINAQNPSLEKLLDHVDHIADIAGVDCIGLGSDFDGIDEVTPGLEDATSFPLVTEGLLKRGYKIEEVAGIMGGNFLRVIKSVLCKS